MLESSIKRVRHEGDAAVELTTPALRLVVVTGRGPRVAHLSRPDGKNLLLWKPGRYRRNAWDLMGGHRCWLARPGADEAEETYAADNRACAVELGADFFTVQAPTDPVARLTRGLTIQTLAADRVRVRHFVRNESDMLWSGALWGLTCTVPTPTTTYTVPMSDGTNWDTSTMTFFKAWGGTHTGAYDDPQFKLTPEGLLIRALGQENKRALRTAPGIIAMHDRDRDSLFVKRAPWRTGASYPLESNLALYTGPDAFMVEMETMSPSVTLRPGEQHQHDEEWVLRAAGARRPNAAALRGLFD